MSAKKSQPRVMLLPHQRHPVKISSLIKNLIPSLLGARQLHPYHGRLAPLLRVAAVELRPSPAPGGGTPGVQSCAPFPAFPDESCTGVPSGIQMQTISGGFSTTGNGQTISGKLITGELVVDHNNVTVVNSRIKGRIIYSGTGLTLRDVDLGPDACPGSSTGTRLLAGNDFTLTRVHMHNNGDDLLALTGGGNITIRDSLFNKTCYYPGDHLDAIQYYHPGGVPNVTIEHNRIDARASNISGNGNAAVFWADSPGAGARLTLKNNLFAGGNYTVYALDAPAGSGVVIDVNANRLFAIHIPGPCSTSNSIAFNGTSGVKWSGNAFTDGAPIPLSAC
ncbi:MAG TPA: right-handed parallel beta-helix repeat-containing protein [Candidatus Saccharimonadales bacterium]